MQRTTSAWPLASRGDAAVSSCCLPMRRRQMPDARAWYQPPATPPGPQPRPCARASGRVAVRPDGRRWPARDSAFVCDGRRRRLARPSSFRFGGFAAIRFRLLDRVDTGAELGGPRLQHVPLPVLGLHLERRHHNAAATWARQPGRSGQLEAMVNGLPFRLRLERIGRDRRFNATRWAVGGKGNAILGAPAPAMSLSQRHHPHGPAADGGRLDDQRRAPAGASTGPDRLARAGGAGRFVAATLMRRRHRHGGRWLRPAAPHRRGAAPPRYPVPGLQAASRLISRSRTLPP